MNQYLLQLATRRLASESIYYPVSISDETNVSTTIFKLDTQSIANAIITITTTKQTEKCLNCLLISNNVIFCLFTITNFRLHANNFPVPACVFTGFRLVPVNSIWLVGRS